MAAGVEFFDNKFFGLSNMEAGGGGYLSVICRPIRSDSVDL